MLYEVITPYFTINCAALPRDLAESELFGHELEAFGRVLPVEVLEGETQIPEQLDGCRVLLGIV